MGTVGHMDDDVPSRQCHNMPKIITMTNNMPKLITMTKNMPKIITMTR